MTVSKQPASAISDRVTSIQKQPRTFRPFISLTADQSSGTTPWNNINSERLKLMLEGEAWRSSSIFWLAAVEPVAQYKFNHASNIFLGDLTILDIGRQTRNHRCSRDDD